MSDIAIKVENISKKYDLGSIGSGTLYHSMWNFIDKIKGKQPEIDKDVFWALKDLNFEVKQGDVVGIIGKNGAGKSTLLKVLSKITEPTSGKISINGRIASLLEVGTGFHPELTGRENIFLNGAILGMTKTEIIRKFDEIVDFSGVEKFLDTPVKRYSSGMYVRLAFAVAAHLEPEILIIDEVLAVGDAEFQKKCLGKMKDVAGEGRTVLFVSHNMGAVKQLCNKGVFLKKGMIDYVSDTNSVIEHYLESFSSNSERIGNIIERKGNQLFRFEEVTFFMRENIKNQLMTGEDLTIRFDYSTSLPENEEIVVSIGFYTLENVFLFACRNDIILKKLFLKNKEGFFYCKIPKLGLKAGKYQYNLISYHKGQIADWLQSAGVIEVENGDFYGSGKLPAINRPGLCVNYSFES